VDAPASKGACEKIPLSAQQIQDWCQQIGLVYVSKELTKVVGKTILLSL
jgi:hypothetical protein